MTIAHANRTFAWRTGCILAAAMLAGCAHLPDARVKYHLATSDASFKLVRAVTCGPPRVS